MITNMHKQNYDGTYNEDGHWWVWKETCDKCGNLICDESTQHSYKADKSKTHFCSKCIRYLMDHDIPFESAKKMYSKKENDNV